MSSRRWSIQSGLSAGGKVLGVLGYVGYRYPCRPFDLGMINRAKRGVNFACFAIFMYNRSMHG